MLIVSGNLSWLNWLTIVLAIPTIDDRWLAWLPAAPAGAAARTGVRRVAVYGAGGRGRVPQHRADR